MAGAILYEKNLIIHEGVTYDKWFQWKIDGVVRSLVGVTGTMQVRKKVNDLVVILNLPFVATPWVEDGTSGIYIEDAGVDDRYRIYINNEDATGICASHKDIQGTYNLFLLSQEGETILKQYGVADLIAAVIR